MPSVSQLPEANRAELVVRLKKIEGQAKGVQRMIESDRDCVDVMNQIAAIKAATNSLAGEMLEVFAINCLRHPESFNSPMDAVEEAVKAVVRGGR